MKVSDYVINYIKELGVGHIFYLPGGGAMHLNDSLGKADGITGICMLHEQAAAIAAEAYSRITENYGVCLVTSGPGGTNAITGLTGAWIDSTPVIFISGQAKRADLINGQGVRQFGIQEVDIVSIVSSVTKYAVQIKQPEDIRYELEKAATLAMSGRPGPVWIDIPLDIQASLIEPGSLPAYKDIPETPSCNQKQIDEAINRLNESKRPVLLAGHGIRLSGAAGTVREFFDALNIPVLTSWNGVDLIEEEHPLYFGRPGAVGQRHANLILQSADFVLTVGTRLNLLSTGFNFENYLKNAYHIMVDIDENEMNKINISPDMKVHSDAKVFIDKLLENRNKLISLDRKPWFSHCLKLKEKYPVFIPQQKPREGFVNTYKLINEIASQMTYDDICQFTSSGTAIDISMQVFSIKYGQRAFLTKGLAAMGFDLPACIGSCLASNMKRTVCVTGDGGIAMNIQELETLRRLRLPVKIFVLDNCGYSMIYSSQNGNFDGRLTGCTPQSGLTLPDITAVGKAFGIKTFEINSDSEAGSIVSDVLEHDGPVLCRVKCDIAQKILPRQSNYVDENGQMASRPLEDMEPLLSRDELSEAVIRS